MVGAVPLHGGGAQRAGEATTHPQAKFQNKNTPTHGLKADLRLTTN